MIRMRMLWAAVLFWGAAVVGERAVQAGMIGCNDFVQQCLAWGGQPDPGPCNQHGCSMCCVGGANPTCLMCS
jgi:hypothetical protein